MSTEEIGDDVEIYLQRVSTKVIDQLQLSIPLFLYRKDFGRNGIHKFVKSSNTAKIERLINTFQEWPQLLDPTLEYLVQPLVTAFIDYVQNHASRRTKPKNQVDPLPLAICRILYTFCKVRGSKVVSRFFKNDPDLLEAMLDAFESWDKPSDSAEALSMIWEEKYIMLLWLSHLALTPFDLDSISTPAIRTAISVPTTISLPQGLPTIALRLLALGLHHISSASKERDAAVLLLVRLSLRPDMQRLQLHHHLLQWVVSSLNNPVGNDNIASIYFYIGILSFLAGFLRSGDSQTVASYVVPIFKCTQAIIVSQVDTVTGLLQSTMTRKLVIKISRSLAVHQLSLASVTGLKASSTDGSQDDDSDLLDSIFDHLLTCLADRDSPVRMAASKALSVIAQKLDPDMTTQLVEDIVQRLEETTDPSGWHGPVLTLSHLLYRRSAPKSCLSTIIQLLIDALDFEQRSPTGISLGGNVRDAACFGIWSVARKYSTAELLSLSTPKSHHLLNSVIQSLAAALVLTATLDPEGNIRRGASAALQELVGRHPDMVPSGISLIQIVDYHAVGLRSRAMDHVLFQAVALDKIYLDAISVAIFSWRAINSPICVVRRSAADVLGRLIGEYGVRLTALPLLRPSETDDASTPSQQRKEKSMEEWHGIYLAHAAFIREGWYEQSSLVHQPYPLDHHLLLKEDGIFGPKDIKAYGKGTELAMEALCIMISACNSQSRPHVMLGRLKYHLGQPASIQLHYLNLSLDMLTTKLATAILEACFKHPSGQTTLDVVKIAAISTVILLDEPEKVLLVGSWFKGKYKFILIISLDLTATVDSSNLDTQVPRSIKCAAKPLEDDRYAESTADIHDGRNGQLRSGGSNVTLITVVGAALHQLRTSSALEDFMKLQMGVLVTQLGQGSSVDTKCAALNHLYLPVFNRTSSDYPHRKEQLKRPLIDCLNDHTIDSRGDIGSEVRIAAINVLSEATAWDDAFCHEAFGILYGLGTEKLDKVRNCAWSCIRKICLNPQDLERTALYSTSSVSYFAFLFTLAQDSNSFLPMLSGFITTASIGTELLVRNTRIALLQYLKSSSVSEKLLIQKSLVQVILSSQPTSQPTKPSSTSSTRLLRPALETLAFTLDNDTTNTSYQHLLPSLKAVHASTDLPTLQALVGLYARFLDYDDVHSEVLVILHQLLLHRYPSIRLAAASALCMAVDSEALRELDLGAEMGELRDGVKRGLRESRRVRG
ncbi:MAG: hypothetical protein Q9192_006497 [Flavoplaca navasiana]